MCGCGESPCGEQSHCQETALAEAHRLKLQDGWALRSECVHLCEGAQKRFLGGAMWITLITAITNTYPGTCHVPGAMLHISRFTCDCVCFYLYICNNLNGYLFFIVT